YHRRRFLMFFLSSLYVPRIPLVRIPRGTKLLEERKNWPDAPITKRPRTILPRKLFIIPGGWLPRFLHDRVPTHGTKQDPKA
ncbi:unnamed protein product, partial [Heterotrigona itama]